MNYSNQINSTFQNLLDNQIPWENQLCGCNINSHKKDILHSISDFKIQYIECIRNDDGTISTANAKVVTVHDIDDIKNNAKEKVYLFKIIPSYYQLKWHHYWDRADGIIIRNYTTLFQH